MKTSLRILILTLAAVSALAADPNPKADPDSPAKVTGHATVTIDVNGKKETRTFDIDHPTLIKIDDSTVKTLVTNVAPGKPATTTEMRTWLGVVTDEPSEDVRAQISAPDGTGLLVRSVMAESPASKAGMEKNDVLLRLDDQILTNADQLRKLIAMKKEGDTVRLTYLRKGHEAAVEAKLASHAEEVAANPLNLGNMIAKGVIGEIHSALKPLIVESRVAIDKEGNLHWGDAAKARAFVNEQWGLYSNQTSLEQATKELEKALRGVGTPEDAINQLKKALSDSAEPFHKFATDLKGEKFDTQILLQSAAEDIRRGLEEVWGAHVSAALKSIPSAPPAQPAQKAP